MEVTPDGQKKWAKCERTAKKLRLKQGQEVEVYQNDQNDTETIMLTNLKREDVTIVDLM